MDVQEAISQLKQFRQELYGAFDHRADALMELLDALSSTPHARSVAELSLSPFFHRGYGSTYDAITHLFQASDPETAEEERRAWEQMLLRPPSSGSSGCWGRMRSQLRGSFPTRWKTGPLCTSPTFLVETSRSLSGTSTLRKSCTRKRTIRATHPGCTHSLHAGYGVKRQPPPWGANRLMP